MRRRRSSTVTRFASVGCAVITGRTCRLRTSACSASGLTPAAAAAATTNCRVPGTWLCPRSASSARRRAMPPFSSAMLRSWNRIACACSSRASVCGGRPEGGRSPRRTDATCGSWRDATSSSRRASSARASRVVGSSFTCGGALWAVMAAARAVGGALRQRLRARTCATVRPNSLGAGTMVMSAPRRNSVFSGALSPAVEMIAPACPMRRPFGAVMPAM